MNIKISSSRFLRQIVKLLLWLLGILLVLSISLSLLLLAPSVQKYAVNQATNFVSSKTNMHTSIGSIHIAFPKTINIGDVYIEDLDTDTLLYCKQISVNADLLPLIRQKINVDYLHIDGLTGYVYQNEIDSSYNFSPLIEAFSGNESKEKASQSRWEIGFDDLILSDIDLSYSSQVDSSSIQLRLGLLKIEDNASDIINQEFDIKSIALDNTSLSLMIGDKSKKTPIPTDDKEVNEIPIAVKLGKLGVGNISFNLGFTSGNLGLTALLNEAHIHPESIDLVTQNIKLNELFVKGVHVELNINSSIENEEHQEEAEKPQIDIPLPSYTFGDFDWSFFADHAELINASYRMDLDEEPRLKQGMDYMHMLFSDFNVVADSLYFDKDKTGASVRSLSVKEVSGPEVREVKGIFSMDNEQIIGKKILLKTANSNATGAIILSYPSMHLIGSEIQQFGIKSDLKGHIQVSEIQPFTSVLENYPLLKGVESIEIKRFSSEGNLGKLQIKQADFTLKDNTHFSGSTSIEGLPTTDLKIKYQVDTFYTTRDELLSLIPDTLLPEGVYLPQKIGINSSGETDLVSIKSLNDISTDFGHAHIGIELEKEQFHSDVKLIELDLGAFLNDSIYGKINLTGQFDGELYDNLITSINSKTEIASFGFNDYTLRNGEASFGWTEDNIIFDAVISDTSLIAKVNGNILSKDSIKHFNVSLDLAKAELQSLNLVEEQFDIRGEFIIDMDIESIDKFKGLAEGNHIQLTSKDKSFTPGPIKFESDINELYTNFNFNSDFINASLTGNTKLSELQDAIIDHLDLFIQLPDSIVNDKDFEFEFNLELINAELFTEFLIEDLEDIQLKKCHAKYNDAANTLEANIQIPILKYGGFLFENVDMIIDSEDDYALSHLSLSSLSNEYASTNNISLKSEFSPQKAEISFDIHDLKDSLKYQLATLLSYEDSIYKFVIDPNKTIINYEQWIIPENNYVMIQNGVVSTQSAQMSNGDQKFYLDSKDHNIKFNFENFSFKSFSNIIENDSLGTILDGPMNGYIELIDPLTQPKIIGVLDIRNLLLFDEILGDLHAEIKHRNPSTEFNVKLVNEENFIYASGESSNTKGNNISSIMLESDISNAAIFQPLAAKHIENLSGAVKGRISLSKANSVPSINGNLNLENLNLTVKETNTFFNNNGRITIEDNMVHFETFEIRDAENHPFTIKGSIDVKNIQNPHYDVTLKTDNFLAINNNAAKLPIYGKLKLGLGVHILGYQSKLVVKSEYKVNSETDITYVMPGKDLELITDEGIVEFLDFENQDFQTVKKNGNQFIGDSLVALIDGIDFSALLTVDPKAKFKVVIDPNSGDFTEFQLNANLTYKYNDKQRGILTGLVEMEKGFYELSFYGLVKKRFNYDQGSTVSWSGEVMDGDINFFARHTVRTNSVGLVSNEISSNERSLYNQRLPYDVILSVKDKISDPTIGFEIDLPNKNRNSYPTIDSKLNMLNQPSMESERNKQVFALLVGGTFIPENPDVTEGSSSDNFATTAARNSVNSIMTQQLNKLTGQFIQGLDVDMGVNTFDEYTSGNNGNAQTRTRLDVKVSKNLFNDRVSAEMQSHIDLDGSVENVGSQSTAGMTEFAVSYKLTEKGNYRIKAFRENAFDLYDGEIQNSGIAFIFIREFDKFKNLKPGKPSDAQNEVEENNNTN